MGAWRQPLFQYRQHLDRAFPPRYDKHLYKERNLVERFFNRRKQFRRLATRYEENAQNFLGMLTLVATVIWLA